MVADTPQATDPPRPGGRAHTLFFAGGAALAVILLVIGVTGLIVFTNATEDPLRRADAVIVLGGEHDGREEYGLELVRDGVAPVLVMSDPYPAEDEFMREMCQTAVPDVEVLCLKPEPLTTLGEAVMTRELAEQNGWQTVIVVSWRYHLPRARTIFRECYSADPEAMVMRAIPREYDYSVPRWLFTYLYQDAGLLKNLFQDECADG